MTKDAIQLHEAEWVKREQAGLDAFVAKLPRMVVTLQEFEQLSDYSASYPTGTTPGKTWRAQLNSFHHRFVRAGGKPRWIIRRYDPDAPPFDEKDKSTHQIAIHQFRPVFRVKAGSQQHAQ